MAAMSPRGSTKYGPVLRFSAAASKHSSARSSTARNAATRRGTSVRAAAMN